RAVTLAPKRRGIDCVQQHFHIVSPKRARERARLMPELDASGRAALADATLAHFARVTPDPGLMSTRGANCPRVLPDPFHVPAHVSRLERGGFELNVAAILLKCAQIAGVGLYRVGAQPALNAETVEVVLNEVIPVRTAKRMVPARGLTCDRSIHA